MAYRTSNQAYTKGLDAGRLRLKCDGTRAKTRFRLSAKRTSPFKSAGASVQSTTGSRGVRISGSNAGYTMFRGSVKGRLVDWYRGYGATTPLHLGRKLAGPLCTAFSSARQPQRLSTS
jgi:hypothetical protein